MKPLYGVLIFVLLLFALIGWPVIGELHHADHAERVSVTIKVTYVDQYVDTLTYSLPYDYHLQIMGSQGGYWLAYCQTDYPPLTGTHWKTLEEGVIRFRILNSKQ